jgi:ABC-type glycerol-3-phosphate transport system substrate-binding protein
MLSLFANLLFLTLASAEQPPAALERLRIVVPLEKSAAFDHEMTSLVSHFNASETGFQVELVRRGDSFQCLRSIIASHYANDLPDIALINVADLPVLNQLHIAQVVPPKWFAAKKFNSVLQTNTLCTGQPCSIPFQRRVPVWFYNRELLFQLNQPTDRIPTAWPEVAALALKLSRSAPIFGIALPNSGDTALSHWSALGLTSLSPSPVEPTIDWVTRLASRKPDWIAGVFPGRPNKTEATQAFIEKKTAILLGTSNQLTYFKTATDFKVGAALPEGDLTWSGTDFILFDHGARQEMALKFLDYLYRPEVAEAIAKASATLPVSLNHRIADNSGLIKTAFKRRLRPISTDKIAPHLREDWANQSWQAIEKSAPRELRPILQKILSTNPR